MSLLKVKKIINKSKNKNNNYNSNKIIKNLF